MEQTQCWCIVVCTRLTTTADATIVQPQSEAYAPALSWGSCAIAPSAHRQSGHGTSAEWGRAASSFTLDFGTVPARSGGRLLLAGLDHRQLGSTASTTGFANLEARALSPRPLPF